MKYRLKYLITYLGVEGCEGSSDEDTDDCKDQTLPDALLDRVPWKGRHGGTGNTGGRETQGEERCRERETRGEERCGERETHGKETGECTVRVLRYTCESVHQSTNQRQCVCMYVYVYVYVCM